MIYHFNIRAVVRKFANLNLDRASGTTADPETKPFATLASESALLRTSISARSVRESQLMTTVKHAEQSDSNQARAACGAVPTFFKFTQGALAKCLRWRGAR